jgi:hypothetical protein
MARRRKSLARRNALGLEGGRGLLAPEAALLAPVRAPDEVLAHHFAGLTESFLSAFDRFFRWGGGIAGCPDINPRALESAVGAPLPDANPRAWQLPAHASLPAFDPELFVGTVASGASAAASLGAWADIYAQFVESPNFSRWFGAGCARSEACYAAALRRARALVDPSTAAAASSEPKSPPQVLREAVRAGLARALAEPDPALDAELRGRSDNLGSEADRLQRFWDGLA